GAARRRASSRERGARGAAFALAPGPGVAQDENDNPQPEGGAGADPGRQPRRAAPRSRVMSRPTAVVVGVGAEHGLGAALSRRFAAAGHHVLVAGRTPARIERVVGTIAKAGDSAEAVPTDATREDDVLRLFDRALSPGDGREPADLVVFNAGNNQKIDFRETTAAEFEAFWRVGCYAGFLVGREAARRLAPLGRGTVIFTGASGSLR